MDKYKARVKCGSHTVTAWFAIVGDEPHVYREANAWIGRQAVHFAPKPVKASLQKFVSWQPPAANKGLSNVTITTNNYYQEIEHV